MPSSQFSHLMQGELKAALLSRLKVAVNLKRESRQLRKRLREVESELFAIEFELKQIQKLLGVKIIWRE